MCMQLPNVNANEESWVQERMKEFRRKIVNHNVNCTFVKR